MGTISLISASLALGVSQGTTIASVAPRAIPALTLLLTLFLAETASSIQTGTSAILVLKATNAWRRTENQKNVWKMSTHLKER
jgi:hypothetical protein